MATHSTSHLTTFSNTYYSRTNLSFQRPSLHKDDRDSNNINHTHTFFGYYLPASTVVHFVLYGKMIMTIGLVDLHFAAAAIYKTNVRTAHIHMNLAPHTYSNISIITDTIMTLEREFEKNGSITQSVPQAAKNTF